MQTAYHNSRQSKYRAPFGAVKTSDKFRLSLSVSDELNSQLTSVKLRIWIYDSERLIDPIAVTQDGDGMLYSFELTAPEEPLLIWYCFILKTPSRTLYYGGDSGEGSLTDYFPPCFRITVYSWAYTTPDWFKKGIIYQIFPDRFYKSGYDTVKAGANYHASLGRPVVVHESWSEKPLYRPLPGEVYYNPCDFFGGNLQGIRERLPMLADLGVNCIYLNPVVESPSNHRYNASDYMRIDPFLGDDNALRELAGDARKYGIRIMLDGVFSHTGDDSVYFNKRGTYPSLGAYQSQDSPYYSWYDFEAFPDKYKCWWGFETLPETNELDSDYSEFVLSVLDHYASLGIYSWRLDVADELPDEFIKKLRRRIKQNDPDGILLGEVWEDAITKRDGFGNWRGYAHGDELDSCMGYPFRQAVVDYLTGVCDARGLLERLGAICESYPEPFLMAQMNLLSSHDTQRILSVLGGCPHRDALTRDEQAEFTLPDDAVKLAKRRFVLATIIQMTFVGVPSLYYGDEAGMCGLADPFCRETYPWGKEDTQLYESIRRLTRARCENTSLMFGGITMCALSESVIAIRRAWGDSQAIAVVNGRDCEANISLCASDFNELAGADDCCIVGCYEDVLTDGTFDANNGVLNLTLSPYEGALLIKRRK